MSLYANWRRNVIFGLIVIALAAGIYYFYQTEQTVKLTRTSEIKLNAFAVIEDVCVYNKEIYVAGWKYDNSTHPISHAVLMKLDNGGEVLWKKSWMKTGGTYAREVDCNEDGIYVVEELESESLLRYKYLTKYDLDGEVQWRINATNIGEIAVNDEYIFADMNDSLIKLDGNGEVIWSRPVTGTSIFIYDDTVYVGGSSEDDATGGSDAVVTAFDMDGNQLWSTRRASTRGDQVRDICATDEGVYIVGSGTKGWNFFFITKFSSSGEQIWDKKLDNTVNGTFSSLFSVNGIIYAAGVFGDSPSNFDALTSIINSDGSIAVSDVYNGSGNEDYAYNVCSDGDRIYVVGTSVASPPLMRQGILLIYHYR